QKSKYVLYSSKFKPGGFEPCRIAMPVYQEACPDKADATVYRSGTDRHSRCLLQHLDLGPRAARMHKHPLVGGDSSHPNCLDAAKGEGEHPDSQELSHFPRHLPWHIGVHRRKGVICHDHVACGVHGVLEEVYLTVLLEERDLAVM